MRAHGTRACYVFGPEPGGDRSKGCRCEPCKEANRAYARARYRAAVRPDESFEPAYVDCAEAREHLRWLSTVGVGTRVVAERTGIARSTITRIRLGKRDRARPETIAKILAVGRSAARDGARVDAKPTWKRIDDLLGHGWTRTAIAAALGSKAKRPALQIHRTKLTVETARKVAELHERALLPVLVERERQRQRRAFYRAKERAA